MAKSFELARRLPRSESGQAIILGSVMMVAVFGITAVVFDMGAAWTQRRNMQNVADSAALAGAQELDGTAAGETRAQTKATEFINKNASGLSGAPSITFNGAHTEITVAVAKTSESFFLGKVGIGDNNIGARAKARIAAQNLPGKGIVPLGVEVDDWQNQTGGNILLKDKSGSNSGLVNVLGDTGDQIRDGFKWGSDVPLQPTLNTEPGNKLGQATENNNSGLHVRLARALTHTRQDDNTKHCYTWADVQPPTSGVWHCSPFIATENDLVQATAVVLLPIVLEEDFSDLKGNKEIHVYKEGDIYMLAYFWIDGNATYENPAGGDWDSVTSPKGMIYGRFINNVPTQLTVFNPDDCKASDGCQIVDYDPDAIWKIIQLVD